MKRKLFLLFLLFKSMEKKREKNIISNVFSEYLDSLTNEAEKTYYMEYYNNILNMISEYSFLRIDKIQKHILK